MPTFFHPKFGVIHFLFSYLSEYIDWYFIQFRITNLKIQIYINYNIIMFTYIIIYYGQIVQCVIVLAHNIMYNILLPCVHRYFIDTLMIWEYILIAIDLITCTYLHTEKRCQRTLCMRNFKRKMCDLMCDLNIIIIIKLWPIV